MVSILLIFNVLKFVEKQLRPLCPINRLWNEVDMDVQKVDEKNSRSNNLRVDIPRYILSSSYTDSVKDVGMPIC